MSSDKKPVEHLQAKPYNPHDKRSAQQQNPQPQNWQPRNERPRNRQQSATTLFVLKQRAGGRKNPLLGYLLLFLMTALLATALLFGFIVLLVLIAVLLPIWLVVRLARNKSAR